MAVCQNCKKEIGDEEYIINCTLCSDCFTAHYERYLRRLRMSIDKPFAYHHPSEKGLEKITELRTAYSNLKKLLEVTCPPSRQLAVAITELETSAMWAIKAVVFNDPDSLVDS